MYFGVPLNFIVKVIKAVVIPKALFSSKIW